MKIFSDVGPIDIASLAAFTNCNRHEACDDFTLRTREAGGRAAFRIALGCVCLAHGIVCFADNTLNMFRRKNLFESFGGTFYYHYRTDYPYRDDDNFLCCITVQQDENGEMQTKRVDIKDEWKGDTSADYTERYAT